MNVGISRAVLEQIVAHAAQSPQIEACGLLLGSPEMILGATPAANVADDPARRFELDPAALIEAHKAARTGGPMLLGHYHSHPNGLALPSVHDAAMAVPGLYWLIVAGVEARLFVAAEDGEIHGRFHPLALQVVDGALA